MYPHRLLLNLSDKINLKWSDKFVALSNLSLYYILGKILKSCTKTINLKHQLEHGMINLDYLMGHILYQIFKIYDQFYETVTDKTLNHPCKFRAKN